MQFGYGSFGYSQDVRIQCIFYQEFIILAVPNIANVAISEGSFYCYLLSQLPNLPTFSFNKDISILDYSSNSCNYDYLQSLEIVEYTKLEQLIIGDNSLNHISKLRIVDNPRLHSIIIGSNSFTEHKNSFGSGVKTVEIQNCDSLSSIQIGQYSFSDYSQLTIQSFILLFL